MIAHGIPSSLLIMAAVTPLILWASRLFYRYCEAPSIARADRHRTSTDRIVVAAPATNARGTR